jgi:hypothetical protein
MLARMECRMEADCGDARDKSSYAEVSEHYLNEHTQTLLVYTEGHANVDSSC